MTFFITIITHLFSLQGHSALSCLFFNRDLHSRTALEDILCVYNFLTLFIFRSVCISLISLFLLCPLSDIVVTEPKTSRLPHVRVNQTRFVVVVDYNFVIHDSDYG